MKRIPTKRALTGIVAAVALALTTLTTFSRLTPAPARFCFAHRPSPSRWLSMKVPRPAAMTSPAQQIAVLNVDLGIDLSQTSERRRYRFTRR